MASDKRVILVVEDNKPSRDLMEYLLRFAGHTVLTSSDGADAVEIARREHPDLILMDLQLERVGGIEAAKQLAGDPDLASIPVVAVTAFAMSGDRERALTSGFDNYIVKPIEPTTFNAQIAGLLDAFGRDGGAG